MSDPIGELVVGYDGSDGAMQALQLTRRMAPEGATVTVVNAYRLPSDLRKLEFFADIRDAFHDMAAETLESARPVLEGAAMVVRYEAREGAPADVIADVARERGADLIVMGSRGHGRVRAAIGSAVMDLLHGAPCPVLVAPSLDDAQRR